MAETQQTLFEKCCACLDDGGVKYSVDRIEDSDIINFTASGDDLQMNCTIRFIGGVVSLSSLIRSVDDYNDKLFMLSKGILNFSEFMEEIIK